MSKKKKNRPAESKPVEHPELLPPVPTAAPSEEPQVDEVVEDDEEPDGATSARTDRG